MEKLVLAIALLGATLIPCAGAPQGLPDMVIPDCLGVNIHFRGPQDDQARMISEAGFTFIRMDCTWSVVEKEKGVYDFGSYDALMDSLTKFGLRALLILDYGNPLYDEGLSPHSPEARQAFAAFAGACAERYKGRGVLWEIWNEPNLYIFWKPHTNVEDYVKLARETYAAIKKADPESTVLGPALSMYDYPFLEAAFKLGYLDCVDVVSLHAYTTPKPEDVSVYYRTVCDLVSQYAPKGKSIPVVSGEWGYASIGGMTVEMQAEFVVRSFLANLMNRVPLSIWYDWRNDGLNPEDKEHNYGVMYHDLKPKPAHAAVSTLSKTLDGYKYVCRLHSELETDYLALFRKGDSYRVAAWTTSLPHMVKLPIDVDEVDVISLTGERGKAAISGGEIEIELRHAVKYLVPASNSRRWATEAKWSGGAKAGVEQRGIRLRSWARMDRIARFMKASVLGQVTSIIGWQPGENKTPDIVDNIPFTHDGSAGQTATLSVVVEGDDRPFLSRVPIETPDFPSVEVAAPVDSNLLLEITKPESLRGKPFYGKLAVNSLRGVEVVDGWTDFAVAANAESALVKIRTKDVPAGEFDFGFTITDTGGVKLVQSLTKRYRMVETFSGCEPGAAPERFRIVSEGKQEDPIDASIRLEPMSFLSSTSACLRLDYNVVIGNPSFRLAIDSPVEIQDASRRVKMWVKGDGGDGLVRIRFVGSDGQVFQKNAFRLDFDGWKCISFDLDAEHAWNWGGKADGQLHWPVKLDSLFRPEILGGRTGARSVCFGPIMVCR